MPYWSGVATAVNEHSTHFSLSAKEGFHLLNSSIIESDAYLGSV